MTAPGSGSSDTGISSQTTDENEDSVNFRRTIAVVSSQPLFTLDGTDSSPYGTIVNVLKSAPLNKTAAEPVTVMNHFCPQHGHVTLSLQSEGNFKSTLTPLVEQEPIAESNLMETDSNSAHTDSNLATGVRSGSHWVNLTANPTMSESLVPNAEDLNPIHAKTENDELLNELHVTGESPQQMDNSVQRISPHQYHIEQTSIKLNMITCALSIALWAPFITATLAYVLLSATQFSRLISVNTLIQFKWLSYMSSMAYLVGYLIVDRNLYRLVIQQCRRSSSKASNITL